MSIFTKLLLLFLASLGVMFFVGKETHSLAKTNIEALLREKYLQASNELFKDLANNDMVAFQKKLDAWGFESVAYDIYEQKARRIYEEQSSFGEMKIIQSLCQTSKKNFIVTRKEKLKELRNIKQPK